MATSATPMRQAVGHLLAGFAARIHAGLVAAASGIDEAPQAASRAPSMSMPPHWRCSKTADSQTSFRQTLVKMMEAESVHPKLRGQAVRLLRDASHLDDVTVARHLGFALSPGMPALSAAAWLEGFLQGGGSLLVHDRALLGLVDTWLASLGGEAFQATLPLLRRTFGSFSPPERTRIAASVAHGHRPSRPVAAVLRSILTSPAPCPPSPRWRNC